ncbi:hypothetical protein [Pseudomarimonas salicorniae]|uniref:Uncharacterized protein n=1 Tax=Pseudomarimonas salicorniae TaxID=2933270 RepID=A0ABT0GM84_9GAMM|nr:hypothetical protein [Lysobacter sp. CAU 1642]MCK7595319.1 hypothetical protein [Lysobacter sp. CAU 1642]
MRFTLFAAATAILMCATIDSAAARDIGFTVVNKTGSTLDGLYGGPSSRDDWGDNLLGESIENGESVTITISNATVCEFDFRYEVEGKEPYEEYEIDICEIDGEDFVIE